jgi:KDO2-lipid IV(A) lauroyltransferase
MSLKQKAETRFFLGAAALLRRLPLGMALGIAEQLTLFAHRVCGWRKQATRDRIREVFPDLEERERDRIRLEAVRNLARNATEIIRGPAVLPDHMEGVQEVLDRICRAREKGRGVIVVVAHTGNWDLAGAVVTRPGYPMCFIARQQKNSALYDQLVATREKGGGTVVDRDDPRLLRKLLRFLSEKNGVVSIPVDIRSRAPAAPFQFLGHTASIANGLGLMAAKSGAVVIPVYIGRKGRYTHYWKGFPDRSLPVGCSDKEKRVELMQSCLDEFSAEILKHPESYFWFNKRWVLEPFE